MASPLDPDPVLGAVRRPATEGAMTAALSSDPGAARPDGGRGGSRPGADVEQMLRLVLAEGATTSGSLGRGYDDLWRSLGEATEGGKRFRPALLVVAHRAWGGTDDAAAASVGAALELLHTAFVVHDDVIDGDDVRRGRLNVSGTHVELAALDGAAPDRARQYGVAAGILAGDLALAAALRTVATCAAPAAVVRRLLDLFDEVLHTTAAGELADVRLSLGTSVPSVEEALLMAERKTGEYSFALPLQAAAVLADAPAPTVAAAGEVGRALGTAYQLVDDLLGVFGHPGTTGKSSLSDLRSGKHTPLVAHARGTSAWPAMAPYVGLATLTEDEAESVRRLLVASGSRQYVEDLAASHADRALRLSREAGMPSALVAWIARMCTDLMRSAA